MTERQKGMPPEIDKHGHLADWRQWNPELASAWAAQDGVSLSSTHWDLIYLLREIYAETGETPPMRLFIRVIRNRLGEEYGQSRLLYRLFPDAPLKHLCRYAGLPKPPHCL